MAGPNFWLGQSMTQPLAQPKWPSHNTCPAKLAQPKYGPATWPSQNWASSQTLAQPKSGKNWPSQKSGPAIIGPAKFWPSHIVEKIGPAKIWPSHKWPSQILAQPKFGKNWPSQILAAGPVLGFSPTLRKTQKSAVLTLEMYYFITLNVLFFDFKEIYWCILWFCQFRFKFYLFISRWWL